MRIRKFAVYAAGLLFTALLCACHPFHGHCQEFADNVKIVPVGDMKIWAVLDAPVTFEMSLLPGLERYPDAAKTFTDGSVPGVDRVYFFTTGTHKVMVDSGWGNELKIKGQSRQELLKRGIKAADITDILLTHMDYDHIGGLLENGKAVYPNAAIWVARPELEAWLAGNVVSRPASARDLAQAVAKAYEGRIRQFEYDQEILPGVTTREANGHTPGHTAFEINSANGKARIVGDLIHVSPAQFLHPDVSSVYDMDGQKAAQARIKFLEQAARDGGVFAGMHFPQIGVIKNNSRNGYEIEEK